MPTFPSHQPLRLNEAEWLVESFYELDERKWENAVDQTLSCRQQCTWQGLSLAWNALPPGTQVVRLTRDVDLKMPDADRLSLRLSHAEDTRLSLVVVMDGERQVVVDRQPGSNAYDEHEGRFSGSHLQQVVIVVETESGNPGRADLLWLIGIDSTARERYRRTRPRYSADWPGYLQDSAKLEPQLGLMLAPESLAEVRARLNDPAYEPAWRLLREDAKRSADSTPEGGVREHLGFIGAEAHRYGHFLEAPPAPGESISQAAMALCSLVGMIDNDPQLATVGLRHALAAMHCTHWDDSFMMTSEGTLWDHRAFTAMTWLEPFIHAIDWAGSLLTTRGRDLAARTISLKALPLIDYSLRKYAYMRHNNQAIFFASSGVLAVCALDGLLPHGGDGLEWYLDVLRQACETYFEADGGSHEGVAYHDSACTRALVAFVAAARCRGVVAETLIPECLLRTPDYYRTMASTARPGEGIATSDGGRHGTPLSYGALPILARLLGDRELAALAASVPPQDAPAAMHLLLLGPATLPKPLVQPPAFQILPVIGMLCSCRPTAAGPVRVQVVGARAQAGHGHEDKGSLIIEAWGEEMLIDRGTCKYTDARYALMTEAWRHNVLTPDHADGTPCNQLALLPESVVPVGEGYAQCFEAELDVSVAWPKLLVSCVRRLSSERPETLLITDIAERLEPGTVSIHFQSHVPWKSGDGAWSITKGKVRLTLRPHWQVAESEMVEDLFDTVYRPVYRLSLRSSPGTNFELQTELQLRYLG